MKIHIGWNNVNFKHSSSLFKNIEQDSDFYFVHSFHVVTEKKMFWLILIMVMGLLPV